MHISLILIHYVGLICTRQELLGSIALSSIFYCVVYTLKFRRGTFQSTREGQRRSKRKESLKVKRFEFMNLFSSFLSFFFLSFFSFFFFLASLDQKYTQPEISNICPSTLTKLISSCILGREVRFLPSVWFLKSVGRNAP